MTIDKKEYKDRDYYYELNEKKYVILEKHLYCDVKLHFHDYLEGELFVGGELLQWINGNKTPLKRGSFSLLRPNVDCHSLEIKSADVVKFYVKPFMIKDELWKEITLLLDPLTITLEGEDLDHAISIFKTLLYVQKQDYKYKDDIITSLINTLLYMFVQHKTEKEVNISLKRNIISYLLDNDKYLTDVSLQDFADDFGYSLSHASKFFKENTGMTFSEAKQYFRIQKAKHLLLSSDNSISDISAICGFNYYHLFHNIFKKSTGMTPLEFKKINK